ncbi:MAG: hypothetical protein LUO96_06255 [Methanomicrobiales archaeon]|nr:hypothetical protein [Methanomicrobiales archaeon]
MNSREGGGPAPEPEGTQLKELFDNEIALERNRRTRRFIVIGLLSFFLVMGLYGIFLGILPQHPPVSETIQPQFTPSPETPQPSFTPYQDMAQPTSADQTSIKELPGVINGKANPGFPYWPSGTITYWFDPDYPCSVGKTGNFLRAFKIINDRTDGLVSFQKSSDGVLSISCHDSLGAMGAAGWSSPWLSPSGSIHNATISVYRLPPGTYECDSYPTLEMHELLHVLGFENTASQGNVMYPGTAEGSPNPCGELDAGIVNCLKNIYSNGKKGQSCSGIPHK